MRFLLPIALIVALSGCTAIREAKSHSKEKVLTAAGFQQRVPTTPSQKTAMAALEPYKMLARTKGSTTYYLYADPHRNLVYVGSTNEYAAYKKLHAQQEAKDSERLDVMQMNEQAWNNWGPWSEFYGAPPIVPFQKP